MNSYRCSFRASLSGEKAKYNLAEGMLFSVDLKIHIERLDIVFVVARCCSVDDEQLKVVIIHILSKRPIQTRFQRINMLDQVRVHEGINNSTVAGPKEQFFSCIKGGVQEVASFRLCQPDDVYLIFLACINRSSIKSFVTPPRSRQSSKSRVISF